jgi:hypothetical protein
VDEVDMLNQGSRHTTFGVRATGLCLFITLAATGGGCTLLVGAQLSDKSSEGSGGQGGGGDPSTGSQSSSAAQTSGSGGSTCKQDVADCDGYMWNGCEAHLKTDPKNCGSCKKVCDKGETCKDGTCQ